jgi:predicted NodU family carbamoyl transferase
MNIHGEPLVCSPAEAVDVFQRSGADALAIGGYMLERAGSVSTMAVAQGTTHS